VPVTNVVGSVRLLAILAAFALPTSATILTRLPPQTTVTPGADTTAIRAWIDEQFAASNSASLTVAVGQDGRLIWAHSWGYADKERQVRATPQTLYSLASVSKSITATALMTLVDKGQIDLDAPIEKYLGGLTLRAYAGPAREATVRRVASHVAGLPTYQNFFFADESRGLPSMAAAIRRYAIIIRPSGEKFYYSNLGYGMLGYAIAQVSGMSFETYLQREVFGPLGMTRSAVVVPPALASQTAIRYARDGTPLPHYDPDTTGGSSLYASAQDLVRFGFLHARTLAPRQRPILRDTSLDLMQRRASPGPYGIGWLVLDGPATGVVFHGGGMDGVSTAIFVVPAKRLVVVGLGSTMIDLPGRVAAEVVNRMAGLSIDLNRNPPVPRPQPGTMPASLAGEWTGQALAHNGSHPFSLSIEASGALHAQLGDEPRRSVESVEWTDGELRGSLVADLGTADLRQPYRLRFQLREAAPNQLEGAISAWSFRAGRGPDILPSFLRVRRTTVMNP
jgi:CubicO group peptidase (beta-lactamase class C family)